MQNLLLVIYPPASGQKLDEEIIDNFKLAIERAQNLQDITLNENLLDTISQQPSVNIFKKLGEIFEN